MLGEVPRLGEDELKSGIWEAGAEQSSAAALERGAQELPEPQARIERTEISPLHNRKWLP